MSTLGKNVSNFAVKRKIPPKKEKLFETSVPWV